MIYQNKIVISYVEEMGWLVKQRQYAWSQELHKLFYFLSTFNIINIIFFNIYIF